MSDSKMENLTIRCPAELRDRVDALRGSEQSLGSFIRESMRERCKRLEAEETDSEPIS